MKKVIIWIFVIFAVALIAGVLFFTFYYAPSTGSQSGVAASSTGNLPSENLIVPVYSAPSSTAITIGTPNGIVTVNNFYKTAVGAEEQFIVLAQTVNYEITYDTNTSGFYISVLQAPFDVSRTAAESNFLTTLGINQADACKLNAVEGAVSGVSGAGSGNNLPLSFCGGSASSTFVQ